VSPEVTFAVNPSLYKRLPYDPFKGFTPITGIVIINHALILHPSVPANNVAELITLVKQKPGAFNYGTFGAGSTGHLNMEMLQTMAGIKMTAVHYKGATPALTDVIGGHIQGMFVSVGTAVPQWREKKVKFIAVGAAKRMELLPEMPTVAETGVPGYEAVSWFALFGPPGVPADVVGKINAEVRRIFADPDLKKTMDREYFTPIVGTPEELTARIQADEPKWRKVIRDAGLTPL
jgi:tripartite-type tricarboxylate transporter receptor subunit TctC